MFNLTKRCKGCGGILWKLGPPFFGRTYICNNGHMQVGTNTVVLGDTIQLGDFGGDPGTPANGEIWLNGTTIRMHTGGSSEDVGSGSGAGVPVGVVAMWAGTLASVPSGWSLCDGLGVTPDLRDKFIYGWEEGVDPGDEGGSAIHLHSGAGGHTHASAGSHNHGGTYSHNTAGGHSHNSTGNHDHDDFAHDHPVSTLNVQAGTGAAAVVAVLNSTDSVPTEGSHTHSSDGDHSHTSHTISTDAAHTHDTVSNHTHDSVSNLPPYFKLAFIMKD